MNISCLVRPLGVVLLSLLVVSCGREAPPDVTVTALEKAEVRPEIYADFALTADLGHLSEDQKQMIVLLIDAAQIMDELFWRQSFGDNYEAWLDSIADNRPALVVVSGEVEGVLIVLQARLLSESLL